MHAHVAFTPAEARPAPLGAVADALRATSATAVALASRFRCCPAPEDARRRPTDTPGPVEGDEYDGPRIADQTVAGS